jgi:pimeloyl-ACP methyl ester carboxylesterase
MKKAHCNQRQHHEIVVVDGTGHNIPRDRPDAVAGTILAVAAQARASGD